MRKPSPGEPGEPGVSGETGTPSGGSAAGDGRGVFVSYASADLDRVRGLAAALERMGVAVWLDRAGIPGGVTYGPEIVAAIRGCGALVLCCSPAAFRSLNVRQEIALAWRFGRPVLPLRLEEVEFPDALAYWLEGAQWIDVFDRPEGVWLPAALRALDRIGAIPGRGTPHATADLTGSARADLPVPPTALLGRAAELDDISRRLAGGARLLTLTGPGGAGKTRLALEAAREAAGGFPHGAVFVDLAPVTDPARVLPAVATALGVREGSDRSLAEELQAYLRPRGLLLVLDNLEQVLGAAGEIAGLLASAPDLTVLATSRAPLRVRAEEEIAVGPLPVPPAAGTAEQVAAAPATALFLARARAGGADVALTQANAATIAGIARRLDGLPLAIELAAARARLFPPEALLRRLETRLPVLTGGARDLPERQQTLRGAIAWSHNLLAPADQVAFRRLAVFAGGCSFEAVEAVAAGDGEVGPYEALAALVRQSLLRQERTEGEPRFAMLETIREYAAERLEASGEGEAIRGRHARYFLELSGGEDTIRLYGAAQEAWLARLEPDHDNLRTALGWAVAADVTTALRLGAALFRLWEVRGHLGEGRAWLGRALAAGADAAPAVRAEALWAAGSLAEYQEDSDAAAPALEEALTLWRALGNRRGAARALLDLGFVAQGRGRYAEAEDRFGQSLALWREEGDERQVASGTSGLAGVAYLRGDFGRATELWTDAAARFRRLGDRRALGLALNNLGEVAWMAGEVDRSARLHEEALALQRQLGDEIGIATSALNLGECLARAHDPERAAALLEEGLRRSRDLGIPDMVAMALYHLAALARERGEAARAASLAGEGLAAVAPAGDWSRVADLFELVAVMAADGGEAERGARLLGAASALAEAEGHEPGAPEREIHERARDAVRSRLGEAEAAPLIAEGRAMGYDAALSEAVALAAGLATG